MWSVVGGRSVAAQDRRDADEVTLALGRVGENRLDRQRRLDDIVAEDVLQFDRLGGRWDVLGVELGEDRVLVKDVVELPLEPAVAWPPAMDTRSFRATGTPSNG